MNLLEVVIVFFYMAGLFFNLAAVVGIIRLPDIYTRLHSSAKNTTLGSLLVIFGLAIRQLFAGFWSTSIKLLFIGLILMIVSPIASHALARAAYWSGVPLWKGSITDEYAMRQRIEENRSL
jgi:multicomponent Na+:H+ antiporter subunit G